MLLLNDFNLELPLSNPVIIFSLVLFIILFAPILFQKIKVPYIIGIILAGVIVGPYGLNLLTRDSSIVLFGTVGLQYIMFLAGLELDLTEFKKARKQILIFGFLTFILPLAGGALAVYFLLDFSFVTSILIGSMISTHTLISYPIAGKYGVSRSRAVSLAVGGTLVTDILALIILAVIAGGAREGVSAAFWWQLGISSLLFVGIVFFVLPFIIRWFFKHFEDSVSQYIFVLAIVFLSAFLAEAAGLEAIIGAFFSGLVLNKFVPHTSPLMNRIDFVGNAIFIPFFLISVGMLVDITVFSKGVGALKIAGILIVASVVGKYGAAWISQKLFKFSPQEGRIIYGLSASHAAATLAIILVGFNIIVGETPTGEPIRLLNEDVLNGAILVILFSCTISSFVVERTAKKMSEEELKNQPQKKDSKQRILVCLAYPESVDELVHLGILLKPRKSEVPVYGLHVVRDGVDADSLEVTGKKIMDKAVRQAAAIEESLLPLLRHDASVGNGIVYSLKEHNITDLIMGLHQNASVADFWGATIERILSSNVKTLFIYKSVQPLNTLKRMIVLVPDHAEEELGFNHWFSQVTMLAREGGMDIAFYAPPKTLVALQEKHATLEQTVEAVFKPFSNWEDFLFFSSVAKSNDLFLIVTSRPDNTSYHATMERLPYYLTQYFAERSCMLIYPQQEVTVATTPRTSNQQPNIASSITQGIKKVTGWNRLFGDKEV